MVARGHSPLAFYSAYTASPRLCPIRALIRSFREIVCSSPGSQRADGTGPLGHDRDDGPEREQHPRACVRLDDDASRGLADRLSDEAEEILTWTVERVPRVEEAIRRRVSIFWRAVAAGTYPMLELGREAAAFDRLPKRYGAVTPMIGDPRASALASRHQERAAQVAEAQRELREIEDELRGMMAGAAAVILPDARRVVVGRYPGGRRLKVW